VSYSIYKRYLTCQVPKYTTMEEQSTSAVISVSKPPPPINNAQWPECSPPENDSYFSIYCGANDLYWSFHRPNGTWMKWRTPHISNISDGDSINVLRLQFPDDSEPLKYVLGDELSLPGAIQRSKERSSREIYVFYVDNPLEDKRSQQLQFEQFELLSKLWATVPCKDYKVTKKQLIETSPLLKTHENRIQDFSLEMVSAFWTSVKYYKHPLMTLMETDDGKLHYIGSWETPSGIFFITGTLSEDSKILFDELYKVLQRWKANARSLEKGKKDPTFTIMVTSDYNHTLESKILKMLDEKEKSGLRDSGYELVYLPQPILYGINQLIDTNRVKKKEEERARAAEKRKEERLAKKREKEAAEAKKKAEKERRAKEAAEAKKKVEKEEKRLKALEKSDQKAQDNESNGIEKGQNQLIRKRKPGDVEIVGTPGKKRNRNNEKAGIEFLNMKVAKEFDDGVIYFGVVKEYFEEEKDEPAAWNVMYDDGDGEDLELKELLKAIAFCKKVEKKIKSGKKVQVFSP